MREINLELLEVKDEQDRLPFVGASSLVYGVFIKQYPQAVH